MAWTSDSFPAGEVVARSDGLPFFLSGNVLRDGGTASDGIPTINWRITDRAVGGSNWGDAESSNNLHDGSLIHESYSTTDSPDQQYFLYITDLVDVTAEGVFIEFTKSDSTKDVTVKIADDFATSVRIKTVSTTTGVSSNSTRMLAIFDKTYAGIPQIQVTISDSGGASAPPRIREMAIGRVRQLSSKFQLPFDDQPLTSGLNREVPVSRQITTYEGFRGAANFSASYSLRTSAEGKYSINDLTTIRGLYSDCANGAVPVAMVLDSSSFSDSFPHQVHFGYLSSGLRLPSSGPIRTFSFEFTEQPPFLKTGVT